MTFFQVSAQPSRSTRQRPTSSRSFPVSPVQSPKQPVIFSVRRLLGSRQVVTQCLYQLNELRSILHRLLFRSIKREHRPIHSPNLVHVRWRPHEEKHTKQTKTTQKHKPNKSKTKQKHQTKTRKNPHRRNGQISSMRIAATYVLTIESCMIEATPKPEKTQLFFFPSFAFLALAGRKTHQALRVYGSEGVGRRTTPDISYPSLHSWVLPLLQLLKCRQHSACGKKDGCRALSTFR